MLMKRVANDTGWSQLSCGQVLCKLSPCSSANASQHPAALHPSLPPPLCHPHPRLPSPAEPCAHAALPNFLKESSEGFIKLRRIWPFKSEEKAPHRGCVPTPLSVRFKPGRNHTWLRRFARAFHVGFKSVLPKVSSHPFLWVQLIVLWECL